jgi:hypothetical protein
VKLLGNRWDIYERGERERKKKRERQGKKKEEINNYVFTNTNFCIENSTYSRSDVYFLLIFRQ